MRPVCHKHPRMACYYISSTIASHFIQQYDEMYEAGPHAIYDHESLSCITELVTYRSKKLAIVIFCYKLCIFFHLNANNLNFQSHNYCTVNHQYMNIEYNWNGAFSTKIKEIEIYKQ